MCPKRRDSVHTVVMGDFRATGAALALEDAAFVEKLAMGIGS